QAGADGAGAVDAAQALEDGGRGHFADGGGGILGRIEHRRLERQADHQAVLGRALGPDVVDGRRKREGAGSAEKLAARKDGHGIGSSSGAAVYQRPNTSRQLRAAPSVAACQTPRATARARQSAASVPSSASASGSAPRSRRPVAMANTVSPSCGV